MRHHWRIATMLVFLVVPACTQPPPALLKNVEIGGELALATDARTRIITESIPGLLTRPGQIDPQTILCVEPPPDVAVALAGSVGFGIGAQGAGSASLSGSQVEGIAQLAERTAGIQALLHQAYRACVDYRNGAITRTVYSLRTSRLDDLLVTLILGEVAGGAFGRSGASIGGKANAAARATLIELPKAVRNLEESREELQTADDNVKAKREAFEQAHAAYEAAPDDDANKASLKTQRDAAKAEWDAAVAERNAMIERLRSLADTAAESAAEISQVTGIGGLTAQPEAAIAKELVQMQETFVNKDIDQAFISTCLVELGSAQKEKNGQSLNKLISLVESEENRSKIFLYNSLAFESELLELCKTNLDDFIEKVRADRHELRLKKLEVEARRLDLLASQASVEAKKKAKPFVHPLADYNLLKAADSALKAKKILLSNANIPVQSSTFPKEQRDLLVQRRQRLLNEITALLGKASIALGAGQKTIIDGLEAEFTALMGDVRKSGSEAEQKVWQAELDLQQVRANNKTDALKALREQLGAAQRGVDALLRDIQSVVAAQNTT